MRRERFGSDQISKLNLRVEKPPDSKAFAERSSETSKLYGILTLDDESWELHGTDNEWETWGCQAGEEQTEYLVYFPSLFQGIVWGKVSPNETWKQIAHAKEDVNILSKTQFKSLETLHILELVLKVKGIRKMMVNNFMANMTDSMLKEMEMSGMDVLTALTGMPILVHRACPIHTQILKIITEECYKKAEQ